MPNSFGLATLCVAVFSAVAAAQSPYPPAVTPLNPCVDTPLGVISPGRDITAALQWSLDKQHQHGRPIVIPAGLWKISRTVRTPYRLGWHLVGSGAGYHPNLDHPLVGRITVLEWAGEAGGTMFELTGANAVFGNFGLHGSGTGVGIQVNYNRSQDAGLGVGKMQFEKLHLEGFEDGIRVGTDRGTPNCDELHFAWIDGRRCTNIYHGLNAMGMGVVIRHFRNYGGNTNGILMDGGGQFWLQSSLTTAPSTLLKINDTGGKGVGKNNGFFRLSGTKVDRQAGNDFMLIDCEEPYLLRFLVDGGTQSFDRFSGDFVRLSGENHLTVRDFTSTFGRLVGEQGEPTVLLDSCVVWGQRPKTEGVSLRLRDCVGSDGTWHSEPAESAATE